MSDRRVGLVEACADGQLFGVALWPRQREVLRRIDEGSRVHVLCLGRRSGKTMMCALVALHNLLFHRNLDALVRAGETRFATCVATNVSQARLLIAAARSIVERSPLLAPLMVSASEDELTFELASGAKVALRAFPCSSRSGRGWASSAVIFDELAHFHGDSEGPAVAERVWTALLPSVSQFGAAGRVIASSTPFGTANLFAQLYGQADSGELPNATAHHATTREMNPTISADLLAQEEARDPEGFRGEYLAQFLGSGGAWFDLDRVEIADRGELAPDAGTNWVAGVDLGFTSDQTGIAIVGRPIDPAEHERMILGFATALVPSKRKAKSKGEEHLIFDETLAKVAEIAKHYGARKVVIDQHQARSVSTYLERVGLTPAKRPMTPTSKDLMFSEVRSRLTDGSLSIYRHETLIAELRRIRTNYKAASSSVVTPRVGRSHCDVAVALALAVGEQARFATTPYVGHNRRRRPGEMAGVRTREF
jgi:phage terminase large subunit-like protein